jgi:hypothetical protein
MRAAHGFDPQTIVTHFMPRAIHNMAQVMRNRMPEVSGIHVMEHLTQPTIIVVGMTSVTMQGVMVGPTHVKAPLSMASRIGTNASFDNSRKLLAPLPNRESSSNTSFWKPLA